MSLPPDNWIKFPMRLDVRGEVQRERVHKTQAKTWPKDFETWRTHYTLHRATVCSNNCNFWQMFKPSYSHLHWVCLPLSLSLWPGLAVAHQNPLTQYVSAKEEEVLASPSSLSLPPSLYLCLLPNIYVLIYMRTHVLYHQKHVCVCVCVCALTHTIAMNY